MKTSESEVQKMRRLNSEAPEPLRRQRNRMVRILMVVPFFLLPSVTSSTLVAQDRPDFLNGIDWPFSTLPAPSFTGEPFGAEELRDYDNTPRIPEPMVFDLVRPLGAQKGEAEVNVLALLPFHRNGMRPEFAPEVEVAIADGLAIEFEFPFEDTTMESYKVAVQQTFSNTSTEHFIHGIQGIVVYDRHYGDWTPTLLYLAGYQFDENWSMLGMTGVRSKIDSIDPDERLEWLVNASVFRHLTDSVSAGMETNFAVSRDGSLDTLVMPQIHLELSDHFLVQTGVGCQFTDQKAQPLVGIRAVLSF